MSFEIKPATRQNFKPLIGFYGKSGTGKTYSSLLFARGFVGPKGRICLIDTETGRGSQYASVPGEPPLPMGAYDVLELDPPFSPSRYIEAMKTVEDNGYDIGVIDSFSHCWEGEGGVCEQACENEARTGKSGLHNWNKPKIEFKLAVLCMQRSRIPWIICLRAKQKSKQKKNEQGKTVIVKDDFTTPITEADFISEMTVYGELMADNSFVPLKNMYPTLRSCFPNGKPLEVKHGELFALWGKVNKAGVTTAAPANNTVDPVKKLKTDLWKLTKAIHNGDSILLEQHLWDEGYMSDTECLKDLPEKRLQEIIEKFQHNNDVPTP